MEFENEKDKMLWKEAKKRVGFKNHLITYLACNAFFWLVWYFNDLRGHGDAGNHAGLPWPLFPMFGWGFGLFWHFVGTYMRGNKADQVEKEFRKLKDRQK